MFETIEKLRKAPKPVRERMVSLVTIVCVAVITLVWFALSVSSFFQRGAAPATPTPAQTDTHVDIAPPFGK